MAAYKKPGERHGCGGSAEKRNWNRDLKVAMIESRLLADPNRFFYRADTQRLSKTIWRSEPSKGDGGDFEPAKPVTSF
jgi:hypothetical protein